MPQAKQPVICNICQTAVYCKPCITQWQQRSRGCCNCKQSKSGQFIAIQENSTEVAKVFELARTKCKFFPNCTEKLPLNQIEKHEAEECEYRPCRKCNRGLKKDTVSMQAHLALHCEEEIMPCQFCKTELTRKELKNSHTCDQIIPSNKFSITASIVANPQIIPAEMKPDVTCAKCWHYLRSPVQCPKSSKKYC